MKSFSHVLRVIGLMVVLWLAGCNSGGGGGDGGAGAVTFAKSYGGPAREQATAAKPRPRGGYIFAGTWNNRGSGTGQASQIETEGSEGDFWVVALDEFGDIEWQRSYGFQSVLTPGNRFRSEYERARAGVADPNGQSTGIWLVGSVTTRMSRSVLENGRTVYKESGSNLVITRLDANGQILWSQDYDSGPYPQHPYFFSGEDIETSEFGADIWPTPDGGALAAAEASATVSIEGRAEVVRAVYVLKVDASGAPQWSAFLRQDERLDLQRHSIVVREVPGGGAMVGQTVETSFDDIWGTTLHRPQLRVTRLDAGNQSIRWTVIREGATLRGLLVADDNVDGQIDGVLLWGREGQDTGDSRGTPFLRKLDADRNERWHHEMDVNDVASNCVAPTAGVPSCQYVVVGAGSENDRTVGFLRTLNIGSGDLVAERQFEVSEGHRVGSLLRYLPALDRYQVYGLVFSPTGPNSFTATSRFVSIIQPSAPLAIDSVETVELPAGESTHGFGTAYLQLSPDDQLFQHDAGSTSLVADLGEPAEVRIERAYSIHTVASSDGQTADGFVVAGDSATGLNGSDRAAWVVRLDNAGSVVWQRRLDGFAFQPRGDFHSDDRFRDVDRPFALRSFDLIEPTADGGFILGGRDTADPDKTPGRLVKLTADGDLAWSTTAVTPSPRDTLDAVRVTADGGFLAAGRAVRYDEEGFDFVLDTWVVRLDATGAVRWRNTYTGVIGADVRMTEDGGSLLIGRSRGGIRAVAVRLDVDGNVLWANAYPFGQSRLLGSVRLAPAANGYLLAASVVDAVDPAASGRYNALLLKIDAGGAVQWSQGYGGLYDEIVHGIEPLADGGFLISGQSDSMGDYTEAWILRVGPDGRIADGCNADLGRASIVARPFNVTRRQYSVPTEQATTITLVETNVVANEPSDVVVARQCAGVATDNPGDIPNPRTLTVNQAGSLTGVVTSLPQGIVCGTLGDGVCSALFAEGTLVTLRVDIGSVQDFQRWGPHCETVSGNFSEVCAVRMDADKTIDAIFDPAPPPTPPPGRFTLTVTVVGVGEVFSRDGDEGAGRPPSLVCINGTLAMGGKSCSADFPANTTVTLTPVSFFSPPPPPGAPQAVWEGCNAVLSNGDCEVVMDGDKGVTATMQRGAS